MAQTLLGNVKGPKGDTGAQGPQGEQGPTGAQGPQGETGPANTAFITDAFSTSQAYNAGDYCIYNNTLYRFAEDKAAGEWDDSKVMSTLIGTELSGLNSSNNVITDVLTTGISISHNEHMVTLAISLTSKTYTTNAWNTIATIPEGLRPLTVLTFAGLNNGASADGSNTPTWLRVSTNGQVQVYVFYDRTNIAPTGMISYVI